MPRTFQQYICRHKTWWLLLPRDHIKSILHIYFCWSKVLFLSIVVLFSFVLDFVFVWLLAWFFQIGVKTLWVKYVIWMFLLLFLFNLCQLLLKYAKKISIAEQQCIFPTTSENKQLPGDISSTTSLQNLITFPLSTKGSEYF